MTPLRERGRLVASALAAVLMCVVPLAGAAEPLRIGTISDEPSKKMRIFAPVARYLAEHLAPVGIDKPEVVIAGSLDEMAQLMRADRIDVYFDSPMPSLVVSRESGGTMALRRWKRGVAEYRSVIFARKDSGIETYGDLRGRIIAFEESFSTSGYILPRIELERFGMELEHVDEPAAELAPERAGFLFSQDDENTVVWVLQGRVDAGACSEADFRERAMDRIDELAVVHETPSVPRQIVTFRPGMPADLSAALVRVLVAMHTDPQARKILGDFDNTKKFDPIPLEQRRTLDALVPKVLRILGTS